MGFMGQVQNGGGSPKTSSSDSCTLWVMYVIAFTFLAAFLAFAVPTTATALLIQGAE